MEVPTEATKPIVQATGSYTVQDQDGTATMFIDGEHMPIVRNNRPRGVAPPYAHHDLATYHSSNDKHFFQEPAALTLDDGKLMQDDDFFLRASVEAPQEQALHRASTEDAPVVVEQSEGEDLVPPDVKEAEETAKSLANEFLSSAGGANDRQAAEEEYTFATYHIYITKITTKNVRKGHRGNQGGLYFDLSSGDHLQQCSWSANTNGCIEESGIAKWQFSGKNGPHIVVTDAELSDGFFSATLIQENSVLEPSIIGMASASYPRLLSEDIRAGVKNVKADLEMALIDRQGTYAGSATFSFQFIADNANIRKSTRSMSIKMKIDQEKENDGDGAASNSSALDEESIVLNNNLHNLQIAKVSISGLPEDNDKYCSLFLQSGTLTYTRWSRATSFKNAKDGVVTWELKDTRNMQAIVSEQELAADGGFTVVCVECAHGTEVIRSNCELLGAGRSLYPPSILKAILAHSIGKTLDNINVQIMLHNTAGKKIGIADITFQLAKSKRSKSPFISSIHNRKDVTATEILAKNNALAEKYLRAHQSSVDLKLSKDESKRLEEERRIQELQDAEEAEKRRLEEEEQQQRKRLEEEEAERKRIADEEAEAERKRLEEKEAEQKRIADEEAEAERKRLEEEEAEKKRIADEEAEAERKRLEEEEAEKKRIADKEAEAERKRLEEEEAEQKRIADEEAEAERKRLEEEEAEKKRIADEEAEAERKRLEEEEAEKNRVALLSAEQAVAEEADRLRREAQEAEEEAERKQMAAEEKSKKSLEDDAERQRREKEEAERKRREEEEEEEAERLRQIAAEEAEQARLAQEESERAIAASLAQMRKEAEEREAALRAEAEALEIARQEKEVEDERLRLLAEEAEQARLEEEAAEEARRINEINAMRAEENMQREAMSADEDAKERALLMEQLKAAANAEKVRLQALEASRRSLTDWAREKEIDQDYREWSSSHLDDDSTFASNVYFIKSPSAKDHMQNKMNHFSLSSPNRFLELQQIRHAQHPDDVSTGGDDNSYTSSVVSYKKLQPSENQATKKSKPADFMTRGLPAISAPPDSAGSSGSNNGRSPKGGHNRLVDRSESPNSRSASPQWGAGGKGVRLSALQKRTHDISDATSIDSTSTAFAAMQSSALNDPPQQSQQPQQQSRNSKARSRPGAGRGSTSIDYLDEYSLSSSLASGPSLHRLEAAQAPPQQQPKQQQQQQQPALQPQKRPISTNSNRTFDPTAPENQPAAFLKPLVSPLHSNRHQGNKKIHLAPYQGDFQWDRKYKASRKGPHVEIENAHSVCVLLPSPDISPKRTRPQQQQQYQYQQQQPPQFRKENSQGSLDNSSYRSLEQPSVYGNNSGMNSNPNYAGRGAAPDAKGRSENVMMFDNNSSPFVPNGPEHAQQPQQQQEHRRNNNSSSHLSNRGSSSGKPMMRMESTDASAAMSGEESSSSSWAEPVSATHNVGKYHTHNSQQQMGTSKSQGNLSKTMPTSSTSGSSSQIDIFRSEIYKNNARQQQKQQPYYDNIPVSRSSEIALGGGGSSRGSINSTTGGIGLSGYGTEEVSPRGGRIHSAGRSAISSL